MSEINLRLKTYDELTFEISQLNTDKYLLEQKLQQKENIIKEVSKELKEFNEEYLVSEGDHCVYRYLNKLIEKLKKGE